MRFIGRLLFWMASPTFSFIVFSIASALYWSFLVLLLTGAITARHYGDWLSAIGGSLFFPFLGLFAWRHQLHQQAQAAKEPESRDYWKALKHEELQRFLLRRISVSEAGDMCRGRVACPDHLPLDERDLLFLREFVHQELQEGDELWIYDSGPESWGNLAGCWGFAAVRKGRIVAFHEVAMN